MANLEDLIDPEYGLQQDEWSLARPRFGVEGQLEVIGWSGKLYGGTKKKYLLSCKTCAMDEELFGQGFFSGEKGNLIKGQGVCGCAKYVRWNPEQMGIRCRREAKNRGYSFSGFTSDYKNVDDTRVRVLCTEHGEWNPTIEKFLGGRGCPRCCKHFAPPIEEKEKNIEKFLEGTKYTLISLNRNVKTTVTVKCEVCSTDPELFREGVFEILESKLKSGQIPCGCSERGYHFSKEQYEIVCKRFADRHGWEFVGFNGPFVKSKSTVLLKCSNHGVWESKIAYILNNNRREQSYLCPGCRSENIIKVKRKPDQELIQSFFSSGAFHPDTRFWRSERRSSGGWRVFWHLHCPTCGKDGEAHVGSLQRGNKPCECDRNRQREAYLNVVRDQDNMICVKFGIANNTSNRIEKQKRTCVYGLENFGVWEFETKKSCLAAERECKHTLECGVLTKEEMPDGYTETTWLYNLDKIISIYEKHGGKRIK